MTNHIYTVGHSTWDFDEILAMLRNNEITYLVDVRTFPSRGAEVVDIMSTTTVKPAVLHKHAHVQDGHLTYPLSGLMPT